MYAIIPDKSLQNKAKPAAQAMQLMQPRRLIWEHIDCIRRPY